MFGYNSLFRDYEDPFFSLHQQQMQQMNSMFQDPFMMSPFGMIQSANPDARARDLDYNRRGERQRLAGHGIDAYGGGGAMMPFAPMPSNLFAMMGVGSLPNIQQLSQQILQESENDPNSQFVSHSSVMSYSNVGDGAPRIYQASTSTRQAPGGVRETRKEVRDSAKGIEKLAIDRQIGDKKHMVTRKRDLRTGNVEENKDLVNLDEEEEEEFSREFQMRAGSNRDFVRRRPEPLAALEAPPSARYKQRSRSPRHRD